VVGAAFVAFFVGAIAWVILSGWIESTKEWRQQRLESQRGFEVKLNTGEPPVPEKKDDNHG
jgi:hypothetical protein